MRFFNDSHNDKNPRAYFWENQYASHRRHLLNPFTIVKYFYDIKPRVYTAHILLYESRNFLWEGLSKYISARRNPSVRTQMMFFALGCIVGSFLHNFESRLWKEKKWDQEAGHMIPLREKLLTRTYNYIWNLKVLPFLYYYGLFVEDKDLDTFVDLTQISGGRLYRRYLCMQYSRKMRYRLNRDDRYDFLEISPSYSKD